MDNSIYFWNKRAKFSWGHIIAFIAIIAISYFAYMGAFYANGGNFGNAACKVAKIDIVLLGVFIGVQMTKGANRKFDRCIIVERILILLCPFIFFIWVWKPFNHFWNVFSEREKIEKKFNETIDQSKRIFVAYDKYAEERISNYDYHLRDIYPDDEIAKENYVDALRLQLLSSNTDKLKKSAIKWIEESNHASIWNAFLIGNVDEIIKAVKSWQMELDTVAKETMSNEVPYEKLSFDQAINKVVNDLNSLKEEYKNVSGTTVWSVLTALIFFLMLLVPYVLQERNTKAQGFYHLIPLCLIPRKQNSNAEDSEDTDGCTIDESSSSSSQNSEDKGGNIYSGTF